MKHLIVIAILGFLAWQGYAHLKNCPGVKMDGNNDGVPCEKQWCK